MANKEEESKWLEEELLVVVDQFDVDQQESFAEDDVPTLRQPVEHL